MGITVQQLEILIQTTPVRKVPIPHRHLLITTLEIIHQHRLLPVAGIVHQVPQPRPEVQVTHREAVTQHLEPTVHRVVPATVRQVRAVQQHVQVAVHQVLVTRLQGQVGVRQVLAILHHVPADHRPQVLPEVLVPQVVLPVRVVKKDKSGS